MGGQYFRLLFHIQFGKTADAAEGGAVVGAAAEVAAPRPQKQSAQPGLEAVLPLPDVGQFVYQPYPVAAVGQCEVGGAALFGEVDAAVG